MIITPMHAVSTVILKHIQEVFEENYQLGNFYLNPKIDMYIRADYPEDDSDVGFKPGVVLKTVGGLEDETPSLGQQGHMPQPRSNYSTVQGYDDIYRGACTLQAIAQYEKEALTIAYLALLSINKFKPYLIGQEGIADIHAVGLSDTYPYRAGSYIDAFASDVQVRYAKREAFSTTKGNVPLMKFKTTMHSK
jgi:hypothetical protein